MGFSAAPRVCQGWGAADEVFKVTGFVGGVFLMVITLAA